MIKIPREPVVHLNIADDDQHTACGRLLRRVKKWDTSPERVTCKACKKVIRAAQGMGPR